MKQKHTYSRKQKAIRWLLRLAALTQTAFAAFFSGQCLEACILGGMFAVAMLVCRLPYAALISVFIGVTALIPIFGSFLGCALGTVLILVDDPARAGWFVGLFLCLQQIEGSLIYPRVVGSSVGLPAIWVLAAVTLGGKLMGVVGMLFFIPLCSVVYALFRDYVKDSLKKKGVPASKWRDVPADKKRK